MKPQVEPSEDVQSALVGMLFAQVSTLVAGASAVAAAAVLCWLRTGERWFAVWALLLVVTLVPRVGLELAFRRRFVSAGGGMRRWRIAFTAGSWVTGALWGAAGFTIVNHEEPLVQMLVITTELVVVMGAAARNASYPLAARVQTVLGLTPLCIACLIANDRFYRIFSLFILFGLIAALVLIRQLYERNVRLLIVNEQNVSLVHGVRSANAELAAANDRLEHAASTDSLTQIANRRRFDSSLADEVRRSQRERSDLALLLLDIDVFKNFNDRYGHQAGDECLQRVAGALAASFRRPGDLVARYGGEEFAVILPRTGSAAAMDLAESVRAAVSGLNITSVSSPAGVVSVSIGVASFLPDHHQRPEDFIRSADEALYDAKGAGRNRVRSMRGTLSGPLGGEPGRHLFATPEV